MYTSALASPPRFQWEPNSAPSQAYNCGPTCVTQIAEFYKDRWFSIEETRRLITSCCHATTYSQQRDMLNRRGVPAVIYNITSLRQLHTITDTGTRPVILALYMARVPASVRGHSFTGWHAVVVRKGVTGGFWVTDPNFSPPGGLRPDPTGGKRWYSDAVIQSAFLNNYQHYAIVPTSNKYVPLTQYVYFNAGANNVGLRIGPSYSNNVYAVAYTDTDPKPNGIIRLSDKKWIGNTSARRTLYAVVKGSDGRTYYKLKLKGTDRYVYVNAAFMHRA